MIITNEYIYIASNIEEITSVYLKKRNVLSYDRYTKYK